MSTSASLARPRADELLFWRALFPLGRALGLFLVPVRVEGRERLPSRGAYLLASNHISWIDPPWLEFVVGRPIRYLGKRELFQVFLLGWLLRQVGVVPIERHSPDRGALRRALAFLETGEVVGVFPEGHRSDNGTLIRAHPGVGFIASHADPLIVPVGISGSRDARFGWFWRRDVTVRFGEPFRAYDLGAADGQALADAIMRRIAALLPASQRGAYA